MKDDSDKNSPQSAIRNPPSLVALAGNPNAGKTTLFNVLTGLRQKVANFPGVTVEKKEGVWNLGEQNARLIDLPGLYSLDATSPDEEIARDVLTGNVADLPKPDVIVAVVDATNFERNLYLVTQLAEYKIPLVIALTMVDLAERQSLEINTTKLSEYLQVPVVSLISSQKKGIDELTKSVSNALENPFQSKAFDIAAKENGYDEILARYDFVGKVAKEVVTHEDNHEVSLSEKIDGVLTHKIFGLAILAVILLIVFQTIFSFAELPMNLLENAFGALGDFVKANLPAGMLTDLLVDGVIAGVGGVMVFLPQILLLFFFITILEDTGYMARAAFLLDRLMRGVGLHGKAFLPLLSSFACAIPGIMATRTIESRRDRLATILIAPFMSCSARLPVYTLMIATFFNGKTVFGFISVAAVLMLAMYSLGIFVAIAVAFILKRTILKAPTPPLILELPPYRFPNWKTILVNMLTRAGMFVKRAGTVILAISIILWALTNFPRTENVGVPNGENVAEVQQNFQQSEQLKNSFAGRFGHFIEPAIKPLGFDWKIGIGLIASFGAREVLVSTLSIIYNVGKDSEADSETLTNAVRNAKNDDGKPSWTPLTALSMMVFFVLAMQCMSTVAVVRRETNSWSWTIFMVIYMTGLAYLASLLTYQGGKFLGF